MTGAKAGTDVAAVDPRLLIDQSPMRRPQILLLLLCVLLMAIDGYDVLSISFASPGIAREWHMEAASLGVLLSMELVGMGIGSVILGHLADRIGRRPTALLCLIVMASGMWMAVFAMNAVTLGLFRLYTGFGIGGILACANAIATEISNARSKSLAVALMASGYPVGAILGGPVAAMLMADGHWRHVFILGAVVSTLLVPVTWWFLPETVSFAFRSGKEDRLERINRALGRLGYAAIGKAAPLVEESRASHLSELFRDGQLRITLLLAAAYFLHVMTNYFILKWVPKIAIDMGFPAEFGVTMLVWVNVGGVAGSFLLSFLSLRMDVRHLVFAAMLSTTVMLGIFGFVPREPVALLSVVAVLGFCSSAAVVGLYPIIARSYPSALRATGAGAIVGFGRIGSAIGPVVAGILFSLSFGISGVAVAMSMGSLFAAIALTRLFGMRFDMR